jgi:hypothetical protein
MRQSERDLRLFRWILIYGVILIPICYALCFGLFEYGVSGLLVAVQSFLEPQWTTSFEGELVIPL